MSGIRTALRCLVLLSLCVLVSSEACKARHRMTCVCRTDALNTPARGRRGSNDLLGDADGVSDAGMLSHPRSSVAGVAHSLPCGRVVLCCVVLCCVVLCCVVLCCVVLCCVVLCCVGL